MTSRRKPHTPAAPRLDSAPDADENRPACEGNPQPYDILMDFISGPEHRAALAEAKRICGSCPLQSTCLVENRDEPWVKAMTGRNRPGPTPTAPCGTVTAARRHERNGEPMCDACRAASSEARRQRYARTYGLVEKRDRVAEETKARKEDLARLVADGANLAEACRVLNIRRDTLNKWCLRNGATDLYHRLNGTKPKGAVA